MDADPSRRVRPSGAGTTSANNTNTTNTTTSSRTHRNRPARPGLPQQSSIRLRRLPTAELIQPNAGSLQPVRSMLDVEEEQEPQSSSNHRAPVACPKRDEEQSGGDRIIQPVRSMLDAGEDVQARDMQTPGGLGEQDQISGMPQPPPATHAGKHDGGSVHRERLGRFGRRRLTGRFGTHGGDRAVAQQPRDSHADEGYESSIVNMLDVLGKSTDIDVHPQTVLWSRRLTQF
jgi:hypothetical protein